MGELSTTGPADAGIKGAVATSELERHERAVARRSAESRATVPSVEYGTSAAMDAALAREAELGCGTTAILVLAVARALRSVPRVNGAYRDGRYERYGRVNVGVTFAEDGLYLIPTVFDADHKTAPEIAGELADLFERGRAGSLAPAELGGATFTLTDAARHGIATLTPLIVPPQAAALAAGPVREVPVFRDGAVEAGHTIELVLACDHRIVYGAHAARFLQEVRAHLEEEGP